MFFNRLTTITCFIAICTTAAAQKDINYKFGNVTAKDFDISNAAIADSDAAAVVLYEAGSTHFIGNEKGWFSYVFTCTKKIKVINKRAFDASNCRHWIVFKR